MDVRPSLSSSSSYCNTGSENDADNSQGKFGNRLDSLTITTGISQLFPILSVLESRSEAGVEAKGGRLLIFSGCPGVSCYQ